MVVRRLITRSFEGHILAASTTDNSRRISFAKITEPLEVPQLLSLQTDSFDWLVGNEAWEQQVQARVDAGEDVHAGRSRFEPLEGVMLVAGQGPVFPHADEYLRDLTAFRAAAQVEESKDNIL